MPKRSAEIMSIFGQIESVIAQAMVDEKKLTMIPRQQIPPSVAFNDRGMPALFAVVVPVKHLAEFNSRISQLRA